MGFKLNLKDGRHKFFHTFSHMITHTLTTYTPPTHPKLVSHLLNLRVDKSHNFLTGQENTLFTDPISEGSG